MPTTWNGFQRHMYQGIPVWKNGAAEFFYYDTDLTKPVIKIGTEADGFANNWKELCAERLEAHRAALGPRVRAAASAGAQKK